LWTTYKGAAFSLPGQFAPWSESANRTLADSLPGTFALKSIRSQEHSLSGTFVPCYLRYLMLSSCDFVILVFALSNGRECKCKTAKVHGNRHIKRAKVSRNESSIAPFPGAKRPGSERARERISQGANWPGSYWPIRSGEGLAGERKGSMPI